jgi:hypothetical protein
VLLMPAMILTMRAVRRHYAKVAEEVELAVPIHTGNLTEPLVLLPIDHWNLIAEKAVRYAWTLSREIHVLHVECGEKTDELRECWSKLVAAPAAAAMLPVPKLVILESPYRFIVRPIIDYAMGLQEEHKDRNITMLIPELVESHWWHYFLHNNRPEAIRALLLFNGNQRITVVSIPYHVKA